MSVDLNALGKGIHRHIQEQDFQLGVEAERERREEWLNRVRTWYPEKADIWMEGYETAETRIIKRLIDRGVMRIDALGDMVFVNCNTLEVEYLGDTLSKGEEDAR